MNRRLSRPDLVSPAIGRSHWSAGPTPEGTWPYIGALLLAYYDPDGRLIYACHVGSGINQAEPEQLW